MTTTLPDVFLPYQQELMAEVDRNVLIAVEKSRRTGYTWTVAAIAVMEAMKARSVGGQDVIYMAYEKDIAREFIDYCAMWAKAFQHAASEVEELVLPDPDRPNRTIWTFRISFASGFDIVAVPNAARRLRGRQGLVILDEAAFMDDLDAVLTAAYALLIWGGKVVVISTHNGDENPFNVLINEIRSGRRDGKVIRLTFNEAQQQGLFKRVCLRERKPWSQAAEDAWRAKIFGTYRHNADEELHVIPSAGSGAYLPLPLIQKCTVEGIPVIRWESPKEFENWPLSLREREIDAWCLENLTPILQTLDKKARYAFGSDFARRGDLTVDLLASIEPNTARKTRLVVELRRMPFKQQEQVLFCILDAVRDRLVGAALDASGNGMQIAEAAGDRYGARVQQVIINDPWYREAMPPYKAAFEDGLIELPRDTGIEDDHRAVKLVRGVAKIPDRTRDDSGLKRHGDAAIAGCMMYFASRQPPQEYGYTAAGPRDPNPNRWVNRADDWDDDDRPGGTGIMPELRSRGLFA